MVPLLVAALRDDRFYPSAPEFAAAIGPIYDKMRWTRAITAR